MKKVSQPTNLKILPQTDILPKGEEGAIVSMKFSRNSATAIDFTEKAL